MTKGTLVALLLCSTLAEAKPYQPLKYVTVKEVARAQPPDTGPTVRILSPPELDMIETAPPVLRGPKNDSSRQYYETLPKDPKATLVRLEVKNWKVAPGGPGIVLVLDNGWALELHDLSKPIDLVSSFDLRTPQDPYGHGRLDESWHFLAAFPVTADGLAVGTPGSLDVVHFAYGERPGGNLGPEDFKDKPQIVVNRAAMGAMVRRNSDGSLGGRLLRDPQKTPVDVQIWWPNGVPPQECVVPLLLEADGGNEPVDDGNNPALKEVILGPNSPSTLTARVKVPGVFQLSQLGQERFSQAVLYAGPLECRIYRQVALGEWAGAGVRFFNK